MSKWQIITQGPLYKVVGIHGGVVPGVLGGLFTHSDLAQLAINRYEKDQETPEKPERKPKNGTSKD